jgi:DNA-binding beta-propeller fold protein YncE
MSPSIIPVAGPTVVGQGRYVYKPDPTWPRLPEGVTLSEAAAVAADSRGRVYVFARVPHRVLVFAADGSFLTTWGEGQFARPHGLFIGPDDGLYLTDDLGHTVRKFTTEGNLLLTLGVQGRASDTGVSGMDYRTICRTAGPFCYPTNLALSPSGDLYISDGYGNARVHQFSPDGRHIRTWGEIGSGPGQFQLPHGIAVDRQGTVYVADRENSRIQLFTPEGKYLAQWTDVARPCQVFIDSEGMVMVAELGHRAGRWPNSPPPAADAVGGRVSIFNPAGKLLSRWGGGERPSEPGDFLAPHDLWVDGRGDLYVAEVIRSAGDPDGPAGHALQKFVRCADGDSSACQPR